MSVKQRAKFIIASIAARLGLAWPTGGTPTLAHPGEQIDIQLCGSTPGMAGQFPAAVANDQL